MATTYSIRPLAVMIKASGFHHHPAPAALTGPTLLHWQQVSHLLALRTHGATSLDRTVTT